jgi:cell division protein FtsQ
MTAPAPTVKARALRAAAAIFALAALALGAWYGYDSIASQPIRRVVFAGDTGRIARADLEAFARAVSGAASSAGSLEAVREAAKRIPWVREATVRRRFPDAVEVSFETHVALARFEDGTLVSTRGEIFSARDDEPLPRFSGPEASASSMARTYPAVLAALAPLAAGVKELRLTPRGAWQAVLDTGLVLELGRGDFSARLARFVAAWPQLEPEARAARHADLRYANGFALERGKSTTR